jgi:hypothetical protein
MVFNATFNNISVISGRSVLLVEETRVPREIIDLPQVTDKLYHIMWSWLNLAWAGIKLTTSVAIGTESTGSCKSKYHTITAMMAPTYNRELFQWKNVYDVCVEAILCKSVIVCLQLYTLYLYCHWGSNYQVGG